MVEHRERLMSNHLEPVPPLFTLCHSHAWAGISGAADAVISCIGGGTQISNVILKLDNGIRLWAVESGIVTFEDEVLAHPMLPDGRSVGESVLPTIERAYQTGQVPELLPGFRELGDRTS